MTSGKKSRSRRRARRAPEKVDVRQSLRLYRRLLEYVRPYVWIFALAIVAMMITAATDGALVALMKPMLDGGFVQKDPDVIRYLPILIVVVGLVRGVAGFAAEYSMAYVGRRVVHDMRSTMFKRLVHLPTAFYDANSSGVLISKVIYDVEQVAGAATRSLITVVMDGARIIVLLGLMTYWNWQLTLIILVVVPVVAWVMRVMTGRFRQVSRMLQQSMGNISQVVQQAVEGQRVVKTFCGQREEVETFARANNKNRQQAMKKVATSAAGTGTIHLLALCALAVVVYFALLQASADKTTVGGFISYIGAVMMLTAPIRRLAQINETIQGGLAASQSVFALADEIPERDDGSLDLEHVTGRIEYRHVSFRYPQTDKDALQDVSFAIEPGQTVALVGPSGSGKTTIASLLPRFYPIDQGEILLDGLNVNTLKLDELRKQISIVSQETVLFDDSIRNNIAYGQSSSASEARVIEAAEAANVMDFVKDLPEGLDTLIGERGVRLSGGQRQRIAIARALLKNAPILILDEATSSLDTESERHVQAAMERLMKNRTTLVIAHRLSTIENADRIVVMQGGRIVESGSHRELIALDGVYARLHRLQFAAA